MSGIFGCCIAALGPSRYDRRARRYLWPLLAYWTLCLALFLAVVATDSTGTGRWAMSGALACTLAAHLYLVAGVLDAWVGTATP